MTSPPDSDDSPPADGRHAPATLRNRDAIVAVLRDELPASGTVLEIASGTGEHAVYFAQAFPHLTWQPSDPDSTGRQSIHAWTASSGAANILPPLDLDALADKWEVDPPAALLCINMVHISPWEATIGLFAKAAQLLAPGVLFYFYGPYWREGEPPAEGNLAFDRSLKSRDLRWGLRDVTDMDDLAASCGFARTALVEMPANNISLIYRRSTAD